jgi:hypothetical protein
MPQLSLNPYTRASKRILLEPGKTSHIRPNFYYVLLLLIVITEYGCENESGRSANYYISEAMESQKSERPFRQLQFTIGGDTWDLGRSLYLVALLSDTCDHCQVAVHMLNEMTMISDLPPMIGLVLGQEVTLEEFRLSTDAQFPLQLIEPIVFFQLIGSAPPRVVLFLPLLRRPFCCA